MASETELLADLRRRIDEIDAQMHDLLIERTEVAQQIGARKQNGPVLMRPGREAEVLRRLIARHHGDLPKALLVRIWREIFAALTALQGSLAVAVYAPEGTFGYRNLARDHFGWRTPMTAYRSAAQVLEAVTEGRATVGVLPVPHGDEGDPWWRNLARDGDSALPRVVARLPFAVVEPPRADNPEALAISLAWAEATGHDRSYLVVETQTVISRSNLRTLLAGAGFDVLDLQVAEDHGGRGFYLIEVDGYVAPDDARLGHLMNEGETAIGRVWAVGAFAVPLSLDDMTSAAGDPARS